MAADLLITPSRALGTNGEPYSGAKWYFYATDTSTPQAAYTTAALNVEHQHPVVADSGGNFPPIFLDASLTYRGVLKDATGADTIHDIDPINPADRVLRTELADDDGASLVGVKRPKAWAQPKTALDYILDHAVSITECGAVQDFNHATDSGGTNNSTTNFANMLADTSVGAIFVPPGELGFKFGSPIELIDDKRFVGVPMGATHSSGGAAPYSKLAFRPAAGGAQAFIRNASGGSFCGLKDIVIDGGLNGGTYSSAPNVANTAIQFASSYSNKIENVAIWGVWNWGAVLHDTYAWDINGFYTSGHGVFKKGNICIGTFNAGSIRKMHTGGAFVSSSDKTYGVLVIGAGGAGLTIQDCTFQQVTVGLEIINSGAVAIEVVAPYFEEVVCPVIIGDTTGGPSNINIRGGAIGGPTSSHPQYASRGPNVWFRGGFGLNLDGCRWQDGYDPASTTGAWGVVMGSQAGFLSLTNPTIYDEPLIAGVPTMGGLLLRETNNSPTYYMRGFEGTTFGLTEYVKDNAAGGGQGWKRTIDGTGATTATAYTPSIIPASIPALLGTAAPTIASVVIP